MATSSLFNNAIVSDPDIVEEFITAYEKHLVNPQDEKQNVNVRFVTDKEEIFRRMQRIKTEQ